MKSVIGMEGASVGPRTLATYGAAAIQDGACIINGMTGARATAPYTGDGLYTFPIAIPVAGADTPWAVALFDHDFYESIALTHHEHTFQTHADNRVFVGLIFMHELDFAAFRDSFVSRVVARYLTNHKGTTKAVVLSALSWSPKAAAIEACWAHASGHPNAVRLSRAISDDPDLFDTVLAACRTHRV